MSGYNKGDQYEEDIVNILKERNLTPQSFQRGGASSGADAVFNHKRKEYNLEIKLDFRVDYGQSGLTWNNSKWQWRKDNDITRFFTKNLAVLEYLDNKNVVPLRYTIPQEKITLANKKQDQNTFEDKISIPLKSVFDFYALKDTFYIQIGGSGFYHLEKDVANLGTDQLDGDLKLRFRAKTHHSKPAYKYSFFAVLKFESMPTNASHDIEEIKGREFPSIVP